MLYHNDERMTVVKGTVEHVEKFAGRRIISLRRHRGNNYLLDSWRVQAEPNPGDKITVVLTPEEEPAAVYINGKELFCDSGSWEHR